MRVPKLLVFVFTIAFFTASFAVTIGSEWYKVSFRLGWVLICNSDINPGTHENDVYHRCGCLGMGDLTLLVS